MIVHNFFNFFNSCVMHRFLPWNSLRTEHSDQSSTCNSSCCYHSSIAFSLCSFVLHSSSYLFLLWVMRRTFLAWPQLLRSLLLWSMWKVDVLRRVIHARDPRYQRGWIASPEWHLFCRLSGARPSWLRFVLHLVCTIDIGVIHHEIYCAISLACSRCGIHSHRPSGDMYLAL